MKTNEGIGIFAAMGSKERKRGKYRGSYGTSTSNQLQVTNQSQVVPEDQISGLIDAVLSGQDVEETVDACVCEIYEGQGGGPFPIGSSVKMNQPWTGNDTAGKPVGLNKGDVVTILMPNLGEHGQDKMVLLPGGVGKVILPLHVLGEAVVDEGHSDGGYHGIGGDTTNPKRGPSGHKIPPAKGSADGQKPSKFQGSPKPDDLPEVPGSRQPSSNPSKPVGKGMKRDDPTVQASGSLAPSSHPGVAVEDIINSFEQLLDEAQDPILYRRISELARAVFDADDPVLFDIVAEAFDDNSPIHLKDLEWLFEADDSEFMNSLNNKERKEYGDMSPSDKKKFRKKCAYRMKFRKKYEDEEVQHMPEGMQHMISVMAASKDRYGQ